MRTPFPLLLPLLLTLACTDADERAPAPVEPATAATVEPATEPPPPPPPPPPSILEFSRAPDTSLAAHAEPQQPTRRDPFEAEALPEGSLPHGSVASRNVQVCEEAGGRWGRFSNGCVDTCVYKEVGCPCTHALTDGCDCPAGQCFDLGGFCRAITCPADRQYDAGEDRCKLCDPPCRRLQLTP